MNFTTKNTTTSPIIKQLCLHIDRAPAAAVELQPLQLAVPTAARGGKYRAVDVTGQARGTAAGGSLHRSLSLILCLSPSLSLSLSTSLARSPSVTTVDVELIQKRRRRN